MVNAAHGASSFGLEVEPLFPENPRSPDGNRILGPEITRDRVDRLMGDEMREVAEEEKTASRETQAAPVAQQEADPNKEKLQIAERMLENIEDLAGDLVRINMEHRLPDARDMLPVFANIRSHALAGREGQLIENLQREATNLRTFVEDQDILAQVPLESIMDKVMQLKIPGGVSKWLATILVWPRNWHRNVMAPQFETIKAAAPHPKNIAH